VKNETRRITTNLLVVIKIRLVNLYGKYVNGNVIKNSHVKELKKRKKNVTGNTMVQIQHMMVKHYQNYVQNHVMLYHQNVKNKNEKTKIKITGMRRDETRGETANTMPYTTHITHN
jgi:hypothetical protein